MKETGQKVLEMGMGHSIMLMEPNIKDIGKII